MANENVEITFDESALALWYVAVSEELLPRIATEVEDLARALAPVRGRHSPIPKWAKKGYIGVPGRLKASVQSNVDRDYIGPYADIAALWYGRFMDPPAKQIKRYIPFLPSALMWTVDGKDYHL
jgi:hypothetical protein